MVRAETLKTPGSVNDALRALLGWKSRFDQVAQRYHIWGAECVCPPDNWAGDIELVFPGVTQARVKRLADLVNAQIEALDAQCRLNGDACIAGRAALSGLLSWVTVQIDIYGQWGNYVSGEPMNPANMCGGLPQSLSGYSTMNPATMYLSAFDSKPLGVYMRNMIEMPIEPSLGVTDARIASVQDEQYDNGIKTATIRAEGNGETLIIARDLANCPVLAIPVIVDASGPWHVDVTRWEDHNCHYNEPPANEPIPDILRPETVMLAIDPYVEIGSGTPPEVSWNFKLEWTDTVSFLYMSGDSKNTPGGNSVTISGSQLLGDQAVGFRNSCDLKFNRSAFAGDCKFIKYELSGVTETDICNGEYSLKGSKTWPQN